MALSAEQMAAMSALLDQALELDAAGRERWLDALDPNYRELEPALRQALLAGEAGLGTTPQLADLDPTALAGGLTAGERVGPYLLVRPLGQGGMAQVWLAQRADGAYQRDVALKLPATVLRQDLASRFARERDILARLEHPNIARLYDAGVSNQGQPYLAMEFVAGEPLTSWCDAQRLGVRERLKLFLQVLDAVQYAHGQQVIHRDLKPSNILVTGSGQVRLLDFGVAKLLAQSDDATQLTQIYGQALTPQYASPEQLRGDEIGAASDVYSLGVLLYELLAGSLPYKVKAASAALLEQAIAPAAVDKPSTKVGAAAAAARNATASQLSRHLQGDLDAIVLKALARDKAERYASASALAEDLRRYLHGEPVLARPYTPLYRVGKFVQRHRTGVALNAIVTVVVIGAAVHEVRQRPGAHVDPAVVATGIVTPREPIVAGMPAAPTPTPQPAAIAIDDKSIAVLPFVDMSEKHDQEYFSDGLSEELIDRLAHSPDLKVISRTSSFYFKGKQVTIGEIAKTLGVAHLLEGSVRKSGNALRITAQLIRASDGTHLWSQTYDRQLTDVFKVQEDIAVTVSRALKTALSASDAGVNSKVPNTVSFTLYLQARSIWLRRSAPSDNQKVIDYLQKALALDDKFVPVWTLLSLAFSSGHQWDKARGAVMQALLLDPNSADAHAALARILFFHDWDWRATNGEVHRALQADPENASALDWASYLPEQSGRFDQALELPRRAIAKDPLNPNLYLHLGWGYYWANRLDDARVALDRALDLNPTSPLGHRLAGRLLLADRRPAEALSEFERGDEADGQVGRALAYHAMGRRADADSALAQLEKNFLDEDPYAIAQVHAFRGEIDLAFVWLDRAFAKHQGNCVWIKVDPMLAILRPDPRFRALLRKMRLPE